MIFRFLSRKSGKEPISFYDPLLRMGYFSGFVVRVLTNTWIIVHVFGTITLLLTDVQWVFWLGLLSLLYLLDRAFHYAKPMEYLPVIGDDCGNIVRFLSPKARRAIVIAINKASILGGGFFLNLIKTLSETRPAIEMLERLSVDHKEFGSKIDVYINKEAVSYKDKERLLAEAEYLVFVAYGNRQIGQRSIDCVDLFAALGGIKNEQVASMFKVFEIAGASMARVAFFGRQKSINGYARNLFGLTDRRLRKLYERVPVDVVGTDGEVARLFYRVLELERAYKVFVLYSAVEASVVISARYFSQLPAFQSAEKLLHSASLYVSRRGDYIVRDNDVLAAGDALISSA